MSDSFLTNVTAFVNATFSAGGLKTTLCLAFVSAWVVVIAFAYLTFHMKKSYFRMWAISWLYYSMSVAAAIALQQRPGVTILGTVGQACIGLSALCLFWGDLHLIGRVRRSGELGLGAFLILTWCFAVPYMQMDQVWISRPMYFLLASASAYTAVLHLKPCKEYKGAVLFAGSLLLWSIHSLTFPWELSMSPGFQTLAFLVSTTLALGIALGVIMLALEESQARSESMLGEFKKTVAQRRMLEQEVSVSEQKYRQLFDSAGDAIFLVDLGSLQITDANPAAEELTTCKVEQLIGRSLFDLCPKLRGRSQSLLENKKYVEELFDAAGEFHLVRGEGEQILCEGSAILMDYRQPVFQINAREITGRKKMEQQLRQAEKLSALGQLVAGVAHELNNPLAVVMGYAQLLMRHKSLDEKVRSDMVKVLHESERAAKIVRNLLTFARPREPLLAMTDINRVVTDVLEAREIQVQNANVKITRRLAAELPTTKADSGQIEQVMANLITNAIQALDGHPGQRDIEAGTELRGDKIRIWIADTGPGVPLQILGKIFDPFFTTKGPARGTGLGLSICYSIMEEHKGKIWVESEAGKGARFIVELPVVKSTGAIERKKKEPEVRAVPVEDVSQHRLLIVDDEPGIVDVLSSALSERGYQTETAPNGAEALKRIASKEFDLIISDLCMPEMSGEKLFAAISEKHPHMREHIIFVTGDTVSPASRSFLDSTGARWLSKPFSIGEVERLVADHMHPELVAPVR
jgi:PAS domain S-box-containing protein